MTDPDDAVPTPATPIDAAAAAGRAGLAAQLEALERFAAIATADGEAMPAEALEMIVRLREIVSALDGLTSSLGRGE
jgi:hypothetical protein